MTTPQENHLSGFGGRPVPEPPPWLFDDPMADLYDQQQYVINGRLETHFHDVGVGHATDVVDRWIGDVKSRSASDTADLDAEITHHGVAESMEQAAYLKGFCGALAEQAESFRSTVEWMAEDGLIRANHNSVSRLFGRFAALSEGDFVRLVDGDPGVAHGDVDSINEAFRISAGVSPSDVLVLADRLDGLARELSAHAQIPLPGPLAHADEYDEQQRRDATARIELAALVDTYSAFRAAPELAGPDPDSRATRREQLAAQIAAAHTRQPHLLDGLPQDRIRVVQFLLPSADKAAPDTPEQTMSPTAKRVHATVQTLVKALADRKAPLMVSSLAYKVNAEFQRDPALAQQLPTESAGVVREIAARVDGSNDGGQVVTHAANAKTIHDLTGTQGIDHGGGRTGTAGSRHPTAGGAPGAARSR